MLYVQEESGEYLPAESDVVFREASRLSKAKLEKGEFIGSSDDAKTAIGWKIQNLRVEVFACLFLDNAHNSLGFEIISSGTINRNTVYPREVVRAAFCCNAAAVVFAHNHPSGDSTPSAADIDLTTTLKNLLDQLNIKVLDHIVVGADIVSLADLCLGPFKK